MDGPLAHLEATVDTHQFHSYGDEQYYRQGAELLISVLKARNLPTWRPSWGPTSFTPMAASSRIDRGESAANRCAEGAKLTDLEATVGTYQIRSYGGE